MSDNGCLSSFEWLYRLYDVAGATVEIRAAVPADIRFRRLYPADWNAFGQLARDCGAEDAIQWMGLCAARFPVTAAGAFSDGKLLAASLYDVESRGMIGPLLVSSAASPTLAAAMLAETLLAMQQHGYQYAVEFQVPAAAAQAVASLAGMPRPKPDPAAPIERLDVDLPFADLFVWLDPAMFAETPQRFRRPNIEVRVPVAAERELIVDWMRREFGRGWASEMDRTFSNTPISSLIAVRRDDTLPPEQRLLGFCCYDSAGIGVSSTISVHSSVGGWGSRLPVMWLIMEALCREMYSIGYRYFIGAGISKRLLFLKFHQGSVWTIPGSCPGFYRNVIDYK